MAGNARLNQERVEHGFQGAAGECPDSESQGVMKLLGESRLVLVGQTEGGGEQI